MLKWLDNLLTSAVDHPTVNAAFERLENATNRNARWYYRGPHDYCLNGHTSDSERKAVIEKLRAHVKAKPGCKKCRKDEDLWRILQE